MANTVMDNKVAWLLSLITALLVSAITCLLMPLSMYDSNPAEFQAMAYYEVLLYSGVLTIAVGAFVFLILIAVKRFVPRLLLPTIGLIFGISVALYAQGNLIGADYGSFDGHVIQWEAMRSVAVTNTLIWLACVIAPVVAALVWPRQMLQCIRFAVPVFFAYVVLLSVMLMAANASAFGRKRLMEFSLDKFMELSSERNMVVIVLDSFDRAIFDRVLEDDPAWRNRFAGFTYCHNTVSAYCWTNYAFPQIMSGFVDREGCLTVEEHHRQSYQEAPCLKAAKKLGFVVDAYYDEEFAPFADDSAQLARFGNAIEDVAKLLSVANLKRYCSLYLYSLFRYLPHVAKKNWFEFKDCFKESFLLYRERIERELSFRLKAESFSLVPEKKIKVYHCFSVHFPQLGLAKAKASLETVCQFLERARKAGVYEKTDFFIMADHGSFNRCRPLFMCTNGTDEFKVSEMPFSYRHLYEVFSDSLNGRPIRPVEATPSEMLPILDDPERTKISFIDGKYFAGIGTEFSGTGLELIPTTAEMDVAETNGVVMMIWDGKEAIMGVPVERKLWNSELTLMVTFDRPITGGLGLAVQYHFDKPKDVNFVTAPSNDVTEVVIKLPDVLKNPDKRFVKLHLQEWKGQWPAPSIVKVKLSP